MLLMGSCVGRRKSYHRAQRSILCGKASKCFPNRRCNVLFTISSYKRVVIQKSNDMTVILMCSLLNFTILQHKVRPDDPRNFNDSNDLLQCCQVCYQLMLDFRISATAIFNTAKLQLELSTLNCRTKMTAP